MIKNFINKNSYMFSFLPVSLSDINIIPENISALQQFLLGMIILALLSLWSFIDIVGHFIVLYLIDHKNIEEKYPRFKSIINYFKKVNYVLLTFEIIFFILIYITIIYIGISLLISIL